VVIEKWDGYAPRADGQPRLIGKNAEDVEVQFGNPFFPRIQVKSQVN
jgi:hypothetical protein